MTKTTKATNTTKTTKTTNALDHRTKLADRALLLALGGLRAGDLSAARRAIDIAVRVLWRAA